MQFPCKSLPNPIFLPFLGTDLKRTYNGGITDLQRRQSEGITDKQVNFFLELNAKHVHGGIIRVITYFVSRCLYACTCLPNTYMSRT